MTSEMQSNFLTGSSYEIEVRKGEKTGSIAGFFAAIIRR